MLVARDDLGDDDAFKLAAEFLHALDLEAEHGEPLGQFPGGPVEIDVVFEPVKGDFHGINLSNRMVKQVVLKHLQKLLQAKF